jgi:4-hydroxy-tetrahydrodipicolinate synthase
MDTAPLDTVIAVPPTPFLDDGRLDTAGFVRVLGRGLEGGLTAMTIAGNTGEYGALSADEVAQLIDLAAEALSGRAALLVGVGGDLSTATLLASRAAAAGAFGVMIHEPTGPFRTPTGWLRYHRAIAQAVPDLAVVPYIRDPAIRAADIRALVADAGNVVAVKYAVADPVRFADMVLHGAPGLLWICGLAEMWAPFFWPAGATAFTSGLAIVEPRLSFDLLSQLRANHWPAALTTWSLLHPFEALRARNSGAANVPAIKEALAQLGVIGRAVRPPISELSVDERAEIGQILASWKERKGIAAA